MASPVTGVSAVAPAISNFTRLMPRAGGSGAVHSEIENALESLSRVIDGVFEKVPFEVLDPDDEQPKFIAKHDPNKQSACNLNPITALGCDSP